MREVISVHVGQAGVQIGNACCKYLFYIVNDGSSAEKRVLHAFGCRVCLVYRVLTNKD